MSLGLAIFMSTLTISLVLLYHWGHLSLVRLLKVIGFVVILLSIAGVALMGYRYYENRPSMQKGYNGLMLGMSMDEVIYTKSLPNTVRDTPPDDGNAHFTPDIKISDIGSGKWITNYLTWVYGSYSGAGYSKEYIVIYFNDDKKVSEIRCVDGCAILGITIGTSEESVTGRLGEPGHEEINGGTKIMDYPNLNLSIGLTEKKVGFMIVKKYMFHQKS